DRDGMRDVLPERWRFRPDDTSSLAETLTRFVSAGCPLPEPALVERIRTTMSLEAFSRAFRRALIELA
ncbi:MAG: hypothetical protein JWO82_1452, partial [Akkermansiaceae bacterium]|nr:hypothetical protein [Akkermansiaceae bacterium]